MKDQHTLITGYRGLSQLEIDTMNIIKQLECNIAEELKAIDATLDINPRWLSIARTHFQQGFMAAVRSVAKPVSNWD